MRHIRSMSAVALALACVACQDALSVDNENNPDVDRVFAAPATIEQTIGTGYQQCRNAYQQNTAEPQLLVLSLESYSQLNNFAMGVRVGIPRTPVVNARGGPGTGEPFSVFSLLSRLSRQLANGLTALDKIKTEQPTLITGSQFARVKSFGFFGVACALGNLALVFDSAGIVGPGMASDSIPPLSLYPDVMKRAIAYLDSAEAIANTADGAAGYPAPAAWMSGTALTRDRFVQVARLTRARFRASVARTPAERAAVAWDNVIADANGSITAPVDVTVGGSTGWNIGFQSSQMHVSAGWSQMSPMYWGMADVSGAYDAWLATSLNARAGFLVVTPDKRWPQGATRAAQQAASATEPSAYTSMPYIRNRATSLDVPGDPWGTSNYDYVRYKYIRNAGSTGTFAEFRPEEAYLLAAEGYIRKGQIPQAAAKIDITRERAGLPKLSGVVNTATDPVPGGAQCVPRVPAAPSFTSAACGTILEAMKYEMRMELAHGRFGSWFFDSRGWGDLVTGTAFHFPVPYQEMDARGKGFYDMGGGGPGTAAKGTYGF